jgi:hypothetical protein
VSEEAPRPGSVSDVIGDAGPCPTVNWNGKAYRVGRPTPAVLAAVEFEVARVATAEVKALAEALDPQEYAALRESHHRGLLARSHRVGGPQWNATFAGPNGQLLILWALVAANHPEFTTADALSMARDSPDEAEAALLLAAPDFFRLVGGRSGTPPAEVEARVAEFQRRRGVTKPAPAPAPKSA